MARREIVDGSLTMSKSGSTISCGPRIVWGVEHFSQAAGFEVGFELALEAPRDALVEGGRGRRHDQLTVQDLADGSIVRHVCQIVVAKLALQGVAHGVPPMVRGRSRS
jgi:hypothetical protein